MRVPPIDPTCHRAPDDGSTPVADKKTKQITHVKSLMFPSSHSLEFKSIFVNSLKCLFLTSFAY